ncbi:MAG: hypothetical protein IV104_14135 [Acidovorax sp.]|nr:hypothetical protein [Acidovorax sp.]
MKNSDDIVNLFQQFGAKADPYQELARKQEHQRSSERWPLVSAVRGAVGDEVPAVDRRVGAAPLPQQVSAPTPTPAVAWPEPAGWVQRAAPQAPEIPMPVVVPAPPAVPAPAPAVAPASRSPLAGLAGLHAGAGPSLRDEPAHPPAALPADLPSVFARLAGDAPSRPAAGWQPRKGHP